MVANDDNGEDRVKGRNYFLRKKKGKNWISKLMRASLRAHVACPLLLGAWPQSGSDSGMPNCSSGPLFPGLSILPFYDERNFTALPHPSIPRGIMPISVHDFTFSAGGGGVSVSLTRALRFFFFLVLGREQR